MAPPPQPQQQQPQSQSTAPVVPVTGQTGNKPELPAKPEKARISSKELIEKQKNWIQHFKGTGSNKPALQTKPVLPTAASNVSNNSQSQNASVINRINNQKRGTVATDSKEPSEWVKERSGVLAGWMASPGQPQPQSTAPPSNKPPTIIAATTTTTTTTAPRNQNVESNNTTQAKENHNFMSARQRFEAQTPIMVVEPEPHATYQAQPALSIDEEDEEEDAASKNGSSAELLSTDSGIVLQSPAETVQMTTTTTTTATTENRVVETFIEEALEQIDREKPPPVRLPSVNISAATAAASTPLAASSAVASLSPNSSLPESEEVFFYDNSVTSARFDEWQLRTPTQLDDSPIFKSSNTPLDFDALISQEGLLGDEAKQLEPDDEELFRRASSQLSDEEDEDVDHLSPISSPPPEFSKPSPLPPPLLTIQPPGLRIN